MSLQKRGKDKQGRRTGKDRRRGKAGSGNAGRRCQVLTLSNLLLSLAGFLLLSCVSVILVLNLRQLYYFDIRYFQLEQETGLTEEAIRANYDALIDYNLITKHVQKLTFPDFSMSENGETHFAEVKRIFVAVQYLAIGLGVLFLTGLFCKRKRRDYGSLRLLSILAFLIPSALGVLALTGWERFFTRFHTLFFNNDYWLFDPETDPVILILPDGFFAQCAALILLLVMAEGLLAGICYRRLRGKYMR